MPWFKNLHIILLRVKRHVPSDGKECVFSWGGTRSDTDASAKRTMRWRCHTPRNVAISIASFSAVPVAQNQGNAGAPGAEALEGPGRPRSTEWRPASDAGRGGPASTAGSAGVRGRCGHGVRLPLGAALMGSRVPGGSQKRHQSCPRRAGHLFTAAACWR